MSKWDSGVRFLLRIVTALCTIFLLIMTRLWGFLLLGRIVFIRGVYLFLILVAFMRGLQEVGSYYGKRELASFSFKWSSPCP